MSLEELANVEVTTVSKKAERLSQVPAAVSVITADEIRRSGAGTLPEALRLAPGTEVAQVDSARWAVTVRGFNDLFAQKLLVMIDGRSVYTPLFSGTFWQAQDVMLEDLDRIEVVRGPGGTIWGANAVNGVINVVRKPARETQGLLLTGGGGSQHTAAAGVRYGVQLAEHTFLRVYGKYDAWDNLQAPDGSDANDAWWKEQGGFRLDWEPTEQNRFTVQGDLLGLEQDQTVPQVSVTPPYNTSLDSKLKQQDGNVLGRWTHTFTDDSDLAVQTYFERSHIDMSLVGENRNTYDFDARHRFHPAAAHEIVWGGGYRLSASELRGGPNVSFDRTSRADQVFNLFAQDEITLAPDRLRLTVGSKVEHNDYTGFEYEPGIRLAWTPDARQTLWASVARAVRTPSQIENDGRINLATVPPNPPGAPLPTLVSVMGNPDFQSEKLVACELGYRWQPQPRVSLDAAAFVNFYDDLRSSSTELDFSQPGYAQALSLIDNRGDGTTYGTELTASWQATDWWRLQTLFTFITGDFEMPNNEVTGAPIHSGFASPRYQASLRSSIDVTKNVEFDTWLRYVDEVKGAGAEMPGLTPEARRIPAYVTFDVRVAWRPSEHVELSVGGQNLAGFHREFIPTYVSTQRTEVGPGIFGKITLRF
ncbi:MAG TPA: TonB-dependent receptor [Verrucomicrobiae bacterium]|nr:TonB-dependent receptor [Verrucomicrobiae bacterium]